MDESIQQLNSSLHELYKPAGTPTVQVLFFHGLSEELSRAHFLTWRSEDDTCIWPQTWLAEDFPSAHILTVSYGELATTADMHVMGENLVSDLVEAEIGQDCPVILVGHCLGGLVIQQLCRNAHDQVHQTKTVKRKKGQLETFLKNVSRILYYSVPHYGSSVMAKAIDGQPFRYFKNLYEDRERLDSKFGNLLIWHRKWQIYALGESRPTSSRLFDFSNEVVVPEPPSRHGLRQFTIVSSDHNSICRPSNKEDTRFLKLTELLQEVTMETETQEEAEEHGESSLVGVHEDADNALAYQINFLKNDRFYVPIQKTHDAVIAAIEDFGGPRVILLHGGVGKGKSALARDMFERYGEDGDNGDQFEHVVWLSCTNCSALEACQLQILQEHAIQSLFWALHQWAEGPNDRIRGAFAEFITCKRILMVLDDVSDPAFLHGMWEAAMRARNVKYLVTSQSANICNSLTSDALVISMEDPTQDEARSILTSLVGLDDRVIPDQLLDIADRMIETTESNPLALAFLASLVAYNRDTQSNKLAWQAAHARLRKQIDSQDENNVLGIPESIPRSLWAAMQVCIDTLETEDAKSLLCLVYACEGERVPETVLKIWHTSLNSSDCTFMKSKDELVTRELVKVGSPDRVAHENCAHLQGKCQIQWSLQSLVKLYMEQRLVGTKESVIGKLISAGDVPLESGVVSNSASDMEAEGSDAASDMEAEESDAARVSIALCGLYFDRCHMDGIVMSAIAQARIKLNIIMADVDDETANLQRLAIEPMIWLLNKPFLEGHWTESDIRCVRKVLLTYICKRQLDDTGISRLLSMDACPDAQLAALTAVRQICFSEERRPLLKQNNLNFVQPILNLMDSTQDVVAAGLRMIAFQTLLYICWKARQECSRTLIVDTPGVLDILVRSLHVPCGHSLQKGNIAMYAWLFLTDGRIDAEVDSSPTDSVDGPELKVVSKEGVLETFVQCLFDQDKLSLHQGAIVSLAMLSASEDISVKRSIANQDGLLVALVKLLFGHDCPNVQEQAALVLRNLINTNDASLEQRITNQEGALAGIVLCLGAKHPGVQENGARVLATLACSVDSSIEWRVATEDGALVGLAKLLSAHDRPSVQDGAAVALCCLAGTQNNALKRLIANQEGVLAGLVVSLAANENPDAQHKGAWALANLASGDNSVKWMIANQDGALAGLVKLLSAHDWPVVQEKAACALRNITTTDDNALKLRVTGEKGALAGFVECLAMEDQPAVIDHAASAFHNLAKSQEAITLLQQIDGVLKGLTCLLGAGSPRHLQFLGARALTLINSTLGKQASLITADAYLGRAAALNYLQMHADALTDLDKAVELQNGAETDTISKRCFTRTKVGDFVGALRDANEVVVCSASGGMPFALQERGILKHITGDLDGALADLNEALELETDDYEQLKHRGYVKFLLKDEEGARADAEWAQRIKHLSVDGDDYERGEFLGVIPVEYLGYKLK